MRRLLSAGLDHWGEILEQSDHSDLPAAVGKLERWLWRAVRRRELFPYLSIGSFFLDAVRSLEECNPLVREPRAMVQGAVGALAGMSASFAALQSLEPYASRNDCPPSGYIAIERSSGYALFCYTVQHSLPLRRSWKIPTLPGENPFADHMTGEGGAGDSRRTGDRLVLDIEYISPKDYLDYYFVSQQSDLSGVLRIVETGQQDLLMARPVDPRLPWMTTTFPLVWRLHNQRVGLPEDTPSAVEPFQYIQDQGHPLTRWLAGGTS